MPHQVLVAILAVLGAGPPPAQDPQATAEAQKAAMKRLDFLVGRWEGEGQVEFVPGQKRAFRGAETVEAKVDGQLLTIEGIHRGKIGGQGEDMIIHHAFGLVSYDAKSKQYRFEAFTARGNREDAVAQVADGELTWGMAIPQFGDVRYTIKLDDQGRWSEIGEVSRDGGPRRKFFEMTLRRVEPK